MKRGGAEMAKRQEKEFPTSVAAKITRNLAVIQMRRHRSTMRPLDALRPTAHLVRGVAAQRSHPEKPHADFAVLPGVETEGRAVLQSLDFSPQNAGIRTAHMIRILETPNIPAPAAKAQARDEFAAVHR